MLIARCRIVFFSRTFALQIGHIEFCLLQLLQTAKCPHGKNSTEAFNWKHFLHRFISLSSSSSYLLLLFWGVLGDPLVSFDVDGRSLFCGSAINVKYEHFTFWRARILSTKFVKLTKVTLWFSICLTKASRISWSLKPIIFASATNEDACISTFTLLSNFLRCFLGSKICGNSFEDGKNLSLEAVWGAFATRGPAGFMAAGRSKFGNLLKTFTTNSGPFFWRRYSHAGNHLACSNHGQWRN